MPIATIVWKNNALRIIDQTRLPLTLEYLDCRDIRAVWKAIRELKVRGAPAIGIAGAFGVFLGIRGLKTGDFKVLKENLDRVIEYLGSSRPTAVNLFWALERMKKIACAHPGFKIARIKELLLEEAQKILEEDRGICRKMADYGSRLIQDDDCCLTICNAGALATADYGTALGVFYRSKEKGKIFKVFACETRPLLQGARLTSWELKKHKIEVTLIADNTAAYLMAGGLSCRLASRRSPRGEAEGSRGQAGKIDKVFVGADRIAGNGDTANKIGTFNLALVSHYHKVPFYVVAPGSTFDLGLKSGKEVVIEHRRASEVLELQSRKITSGRLKVYNPAFDVTPNDLISAFVTEKGIIYPPFGRNIENAIK